MPYTVTRTHYRLAPSRRAVRGNAVYHISGPDGTVYGPIDRPTLEAWIAEGRVGPDSPISGGVSAEWLPLAAHPDFAGRFAPAPAHPAGSRRRLVIAIVAGVTAVAMLAMALFTGVPLARSGRWGLLPDVVMGALRGSGGDAPHPEKSVRSNAPAVHVEPMPGIRIDAPAGALDRERTFAARSLTDAEIAAIEPALQERDLVALGGYDIDAGMTEADLFYEPATFSFDLEELGVPETLWDSMGMVAVGEDGVPLLVASELDGETLRVETRHNMSWLPVLIPTLIGVAWWGWTVDREDIPKGEYRSVFWKLKEHRFRVMYPVNWKPANPAALQQMQDDIDRLWAKYGIPENPTRQDQGKLERFAADPELRELRELASSEKWLTENLLPVRVTNALIGLDRGWDYLQSRDFRHPGVAHVPCITDVYVVDYSLGAETFGLAHNTWTTSPFIVLDGTKIPDAREASFTPEQKVAFDTLQLTALHELFHVVQSAYVFYDRNRLLWFNEAAALVLEQEAEEYYTKRKQYASTWDATKRAYDPYLNEMGHFYPENSRPNQQEGYGQSFFFEFLKDYYFTAGGSKEDFLPKLYDDVASIRGGGIASLYRTTGGTPESLSKAFYAFTYSAADEIETAHKGLPSSYAGEPTGPVKTEVSIDKTTSPIYIWRFASGGQPLSAQMIEMSIAGAPVRPTASTSADSVYVLSTNGIEEHGAIVRLSIPTANTKPWDEIRGGCVIPAQARFTVMRAETYVEAPSAISGAGTGTDPHGPIVFGMHPGEAPTVEIKDQMVTLNWKPSAAAQVKHDDGTPALISSYRVTLTMPDGKTTTFATNEPKAEFPLELIEKLLKADRQTGKNQLFKALQGIGERDAITLMNITEALGAGIRPKIKVAYQEVAAVPGSPKGPLSAVAEFEYGEEERTAKDITGTWAGPVPFSEGELMRIDVVQQANGDFYGTMHWGDTIPIRGTWNNTTNSWSIEGREENVWMPMFLVFNGRLQKLPGDKLYLMAPPALLSRHSSDPPDLGWAPEAGDMELEQLLQQLQQELDQMQAPAEGVTP